MFEPRHETSRSTRPEPLCSARARCHTLRFVGVPCAPCAYCLTAERIVTLWSRIRNVAQLGVLLVLLGCSSSREMQARDAGKTAADAGDVDAAVSWLCYCGGTHAITCTHSTPICSATDPSKRVAASEGTSCSCSARGKCVRDADCIDVR